jgi:hypothetical protein
MAEARLDLTFGNEMGRSLDAVRADFIYAEEYQHHRKIKARSYRPSNRNLTMGIQNGISALEKATDRPIFLENNNSHGKGVVFKFTENDVPVEIYEIDSHQFLSMDPSKITWMRGNGRANVKMMEIYDTKDNLYGTIYENLDKNVNKYKNIYLPVKEYAAKLLYKHNIEHNIIFGDVTLTSDILVHLTAQGSFDDMKSLGKKVVAEMNESGYSLRK